MADATHDVPTEFSTAATRRQIRGSALLLAGRVLSLGINFAVQVLVVRYLSKEAYGAFVDAISIDTALSLLLILIVLTPVQALDDLLAGLFCGHGEATCDLLRKHLLTPSFRLVVVIALILGDAGVFFLTGGYFIAAAVGVAIYASMLVRTLRTQGLLDHFDRRTMRIPAREMLSFTIPLLTTNLVCAVMAVSRRNPPRTLPGLLTFALTKPLTLLLFGDRYESSAVLLAILAFGYYF